MIDLNSCFEEAVNNIRIWRNRYSSKEYPHKVVLNIFYRAYSVEHIYRQFQNEKLQKFSSFNEAIIWINGYYSKIATTCIAPVLLNVLKDNPDNKVGNISFSNYNEPGLEEFFISNTGGLCLHGTTGTRNNS